MDSETITFDKCGNGGIARIGNGMEVRYVYCVKDNGKEKHLEVQFMLYHFDECVFDKIYTETLDSDDDIDFLTKSFASEFLDDDAGPKIEVIRKEFTPGICRMLEEHKRKIEHLEHIVETLIQKTGGGY